MECIKLYLKDAKTGEMAIKFVCRRCGRVMDERPEDWACKTAKYTSVMDIFTFRCWCSKACKDQDPDKYKW